VSRLRMITLGLLGLLVVGGLAGGVAFLVDPTGGTVGMTVDELPDWPLLVDYRIPGVALIVLFGLFPVAAVALLVRRRAWGWPLTTAVGVLLVLWMLGQLAVVGPRFPVMQAAFLGVGIVLTGLGLDGGASVGTSDESRGLVRS
jgi:hypothetical protein